jgi:hypothetical protein
MGVDGELRYKAGCYNGLGRRLGGMRLEIEDAVAVRMPR